MRNFLLRILPFIISFLAGVIIFIIAEFKIEHEGLNILIIGVASGLLGIPLVFICYEVVNRITSKSINSSMLEHLTFELNDVIIAIIDDMKNMLNFKEAITKENLAYFLTNVEELVKNKHKKDIDIKYIKSFLDKKQQIIKLAYSGNNFEIFPQEQMKSILEISKVLGIIAKELESQKDALNQNMFRVSIITLSQRIEDWISFCEEDAIITHHSFSMMSYEIKK